jgi:endonuclease YncB( thermonuclease family)
MASEWDDFEAAEPQGQADEWAGFEEVRDTRRHRGRRGNRQTQPSGPLRATGQVHDGDTFRLNTGANGRLYGVDAFELDQSGRSPSGELIRLGQQARAALAPYAVPQATVTATGAETYGRPVMSLDNNGDAGAALLRQGLAVTTPQYLRNDDARFQDYTQEERLARLNQRGAFAGTFQTPEDYRRGKADPWASPEAGSFGDGNSQAVFFDDPTPFQGLKPEVEQGYAAIFQDMRSKPSDLLRFAKANGFAIDPETVRQRYAERDKAGKAGGSVEYMAPPRVLTDPKDGTTGAILRGFADPLNVLDEAGAVVDSLLPGGDRENVWSSERRFGDVYANNLEQNRSILDHDNADHWWARFGGQLASGLVLPGASVEGVGLAAGRAALRGGASRYAAEQAARRAFVTRLGAAGAIEGGVAGAGAGEDAQGRLTGAAIGAPLGGALALGAGVLAPRVAQLAGKPFSRLTGRTGDNAAEDFADGAIDTGKALTNNDLNPPMPRTTPTPQEVVDLVRPVPARGADVSGAGAPDAASNLASTIADVQRRFPVGDSGSVAIKGKGGEDYTLSYTVKPDVSGRTNFGDAAHERMIDVTVTDADGREVGSTYFVQNGATTPDYQFEHGGSPAVFENHPLVEEGFRRKGIHSAVVDWFENASGYSVRPSSPKETNGAAAFWNARDNRTEAAMASDIERPTLLGPVTDEALAAPVSPRPLTADATDAERLAAADRVEPRDVLPLPSNAVDGLDEAARIERGRFDPVRAADEAKVLEPRSIPHARTGTPISVRGPLDLSSWLRMEGGVRPVGGELEHLGITNAWRKGMEMTGGDRLGPLVSQEGMSYDDAAERAWEAGFFPENAERPTINEFLDALDATHSGRSRMFRPDDLPEVEAYRAAQQQRVDVERAQDAGAPFTNDRAEPVSVDDLDRNAPPVTAYEEWGENAPNLAGNIRLDKLDSPQEIKRALLQTERVTGGFDAARRGRITQAETASLASDLGMTADDLLKRRKGQAFNAEEALAARQILARSSTDLVNMAKRIARSENPGDEAEAAFRGAWLRHAAIQEQVAGMTAEAGRLLQQFRMTADSRDAQRVLSSLGDTLGGTARLKETAERIVDLEDAGVSPAGINQFALRSILPRWRDKAVELYINSLLSGPQTHAVNILSNTLTAIAQLPEHAAAAGVGMVRKALPGQRDTERVLFSELGSRAVGMVSGAREGMRAAARSFLTGDAEDAITKVETQQMNAIGGKVGSIIRTPTRLLTAEDEFFKGVARRMEMNGIAMRRARNEGLTGKAARERAADLVLNPDDTMLRGSFEYARYLTFQTPLRHGSFAASISQATQNQPVAKLLLPFVRTPMNLLKFAAERSPAAVAMKSWRREYAAGGARRDLAIARAVVGTGVGAAMYEMAQAGQITGGGPADRNARRLMQADGWQPYSLKIGDKYYSYARLDPFSTTIGTVADLVDLQSHMTDKQQEHSMTLVAAAIANNLSSKTWLSGLSSALEAVNDPDRYMQGFVSRTAGAIAVPSIMAQAARSSDPIMREARGSLDRIRSRIPGTSQSLYPRRDVFGHPVEQQDAIGPDLVSPLWSGTGRNDPTIKALIESGASINPPQRTHKVDGKSVEWTPAEYDKLQEVAGRVAKSDLDALIRSGMWARANEDARQDAVAKTMKRARQAGKAAVLQPAAAGDEWAGFEAVQ